MVKLRFFLSALLAVFFCSSLYSEPTSDRFRVAALVETNTAYLALSALSTSSKNIFLILPVKSQILIAEKLSVDPSLIFVYNKNSSSQEENLMALIELGASFHFGGGLKGWTIELSPGAFYSFDSQMIGFTAALKAGYQWILNIGLVLGIMLGGRYIYIDGTMIIPDLAVDFGWML